MIECRREFREAVCSYVYNQRQFSDYLKLISIISAIKGSTNRDLMNQLFNSMFGEYQPEKSAEVAEMNDKLNDIVSNYVISMKPKKGAEPIDNINV